MISAVSFFFGITLVYTGFLASGRELTTGLAIIFIGLILIIKPTLEAAKYYRTHLGGGLAPHGPKVLRKVKPKKIYLKIVKSEDDRPTIH